MNAGSVVLLGSGHAHTNGGAGLGPPWTPIPRAPLPAYPRPVNYATTLPFTPPAGRDLGFYRGQFCGVRIKGAPAVPGSNAANPSCVMACLLDNYPAQTQQDFLTTYANDGYTHLQRSVCHALFYGSTLQAYIELSKRARGDYGLFCDHWYLAGEDVCPGGRNQDAAYWKQQLDPIIDALLTAGVVDQACVGWQLDAYNIPGNTLIGIIQYVAQAHPRAIPMFTHWMNGALAWWKTGGEVWSDQYQTINVHDRFTWWTAMQPYLTGGHHQGSTRMPLKEYQDRICDTLDFFGGDSGKGTMGRSHRNGEADFQMTVYECSAQDQFDDTATNPHAISEDEGDLRGYCLMCTTSTFPAHMAGYGNGARLPNGLRL